MRVASLAAALAALCACGGGSSGGLTPIDSPPEGPMDLVTAKRYLLGIVNRDRAAHGLDAVVWDEAAARAAQAHAEDMTEGGFTAHIGSDGSVPEMRYTAAGGEGFVMENVGCVADGEARPAARNPKFSAASIERVQKAFMDEVPPHDGHRKNILMASHVGLGLGLAQPEGFDIACMAQEFVDHYGTYDRLPETAKVGDEVKVEGKLDASMEFGGIGVARIDTPTSKTSKQLLRTGGYPIPKPYVTYFPEGYKTPIPVKLDGRSFEITVPLDDRGRPGVYEISVWASKASKSTSTPKKPASTSKEMTMVSLRTIRVTK